MTSSAAVSSLCLPTSARKSCRLSAAPLADAAASAAASSASFSFSFSASAAAAAAGVEISRPIRSSSARQLLDLLVVQVELDGERLELSGLQIAALLRGLDHGAGLIGLEQFVQLILRQGLLSPFGPASETVTKPY